MSDRDLAKAVNLDISLGHLLLLWDVLAHKLPASALSSALNHDELRAIWAAQDLFENALETSGISSLPQTEWD